MPDAHPNRPSGGTGPPGPSAAPPCPLQPAAPTPGRWFPFLTLAIALVGLGVGIGAWLRPLPDTRPAPAASGPIYTDEQIADAKAHVCEAYRIVDRAVAINTHRTSPTPGDAIGELAAGVVADTTLYQGGDYLLDRLAAERATPTELENAIKSLGDAMKKLGMVDLTVEPDSVRDPLREAVNAGITHVDELCK